MKTVGSRKRLSLSAVSNKLGLAATAGGWGAGGGGEGMRREGRKNERLLPTSLQNPLGGSQRGAALLGRWAD